MNRKTRMLLMCLLALAGCKNKDVESAKDKPLAEFTVDKTDCQAECTVLIT